MAQWECLNGAKLWVYSFVQTHTVTWFGDYYGQFINNSVDKKIEEVTHWHSNHFQPAKRNLVSSRSPHLLGRFNLLSRFSRLIRCILSERCWLRWRVAARKQGCHREAPQNDDVQLFRDLFPTDPKCIQLPCEISMLLFFWDKNMNLWRLFLEGKFLNTKKAWLGLILRFHVHFAGCWKNIIHLGNLKFP